MFKSINGFIKTLIISDFFLNYGLGLLGPIFSLFIVQNIAAGSTAEAAKIAGIAALLYWIPRSLLQIPIGRYLDKNHGEIDDYWFMISGLFLTALAPFGYFFSFLPWHIYFFQVLQGIGMALALPPWLALFTKKLDKGKEAFEWATESAFLGFGAGIGGVAGGIIAAFFGFGAVFIGAGIFLLVSVAILLLLRKQVTAEKIRIVILPIEHSH